MTEHKAIPSVSVPYACTGISKKSNELGMRAMQERVYEKRGEQYLLIKSPPASGKSRALMFVALDKLHNQGIKQAIITGENTQIVKDRARKLKIEEVHLGIDNKIAVLESLLSKYSLAPDEVAYIGDDINDLAIFEKVGIACSVSDALDDVKQKADYVTKAKGGEGAVREVCEILLKYHNQTG